jgi:hypothetical protein
MRCGIVLIGNADDFGPKIDKLRSEDRAWLDRIFKRDGKKKSLAMSFEEGIKFLTMFNDVETIKFEVK